MKTVLALAFVAISCGPPVGSRLAPLVTVDPGCTPEDRAAFRAAAEDWRPYAYDPIELDGGVWQLRCAPSPLAPEDGGYTDSKTHSIWITPGLGDHERPVARHEFGHMLGLQHLPASTPGAMNPFTLDPISPADLVECQRVKACPP